jgi:hypothetical protein
MPSSTAIATETGITYVNEAPEVAVAATASTSRISSVAYAVEESASEEKTARAVFFVRRSCDASSVLSALPTNSRFTAVAMVYFPLPQIHKVTTQDQNRNADDKKEEAYTMQQRMKVSVQQPVGGEGKPDRK